MLDAALFGCGDPRCEGGVDLKHSNGLGVSLRSVATRTDNNLKIIDIIIDY